MFTALILRPLARDPLRASLTMLSVALGVGVVVAIELAGDAATGSFRSSLETVAGKTDLEITANGGVDERWMGRLTALPVNAVFAPVVEAQGTVGGVGNVPVYGVDFVARAEESSEPGGPRVEDLDHAAVLSGALARELGVRTGGTLSMALNGVNQTFRVVRVADEQNAEFVLLDIAAAQRALGEYGRLDRIDVTANSDFTRVERAVRGVLPASYRIEKPGTRSEENQRMVRAFRWNLRVLSYISLVVGAFLVYNTIEVSVVRRRGEIGVLRALGASRRGVFALFLAEGSIFGFVGSLTGLALGRAMAAGTVGLIADTVNSLYVSSRPAPIALSAESFVIAIAAGMSAAVLSALAPAREAMRVAPAEAMSRGARDYAARRHTARNLSVAVIAASAGLIASRAGPIGGQPVAGYAAALCAIVTMAFAAPALVRALAAVSRDKARQLFGPEGALAVNGFEASLARTSVVSAALATAIAMMASVGIMVGSFRETVVVWLDSQLRAGLYVRSAAKSGGGLLPPLAPEVAPIVVSVPGVEAVDVFHSIEFEYQGQRAVLGGGDSRIVRRYGRLRFLPGENRDAILASLPGEDRVIVSEPFANKHNVHAGDRLTLPLGDRLVTVEVAGVYYDYSTERGFVVFDRSTLLKYLPNLPPSNLAVYLRKGADADAVRRAIQTRAVKYHVAVAPNQVLRRNAVAIFDRTFAITYALEGVAILVAMLGAANSLLAIVLDRRREFGLLRYLGAAPAQIRRMILLEGGFLGLASNLLGLALGFGLSLLLIYVINKQSFGWTIQFHPPLALLGAAVALVWVATVLAGLYPGRVAARLNPIDVIHEE